MTHPEAHPQRDPGVDPELPGVAAPSAALQAELAALAAGRGPSYRPRTAHWSAPGVPRYTNRLIRESSPYLLQHAHNPVNWFPWGDEAFDRARRDDKLVFLSVGYATCHWCHVMEHESFEDPDIAAVLNRHFVAVKVDREERPDVDGVYMTSVQMMSGQGGWPMTVWLTSDRLPIYGGTYFPPRDGVRGARIGLVTLLEELARRYRASPAALTAQAGRFAEHLRAASTPAPPAGVPDARAIRGAVEHLAQSFDPEDGGFGGAPKFPRVSALALLARYHRRTGDDHALAMVTRTLERMAAGGIRDHVGGGFHRYAVDDRWIVPHFEKMLYDNAQLALAYLEGFQLTGRADFAAVARETLRYLAREMASPEGGFYSATDADSPSPGGHAEEGLFFTWTPAEIAAVLGAERARITAAYFGVSDRGNFEGRSVLHLPRPPSATAARLGLAEAELQAVMDGAIAELYAARSRRPPPALDDKILASWNGLAVSAFAKAGFVLDEPSFLAAATRAARFLLDGLRAGSRLLRVYGEGAGRRAAFLDDYAFVIAGLLDLYESTGESSWLAAAVELQYGLDDEFWDDGAGGYFFTARTHEPLLVRDKPDYDGAEPAGNSVAALNLLRLCAWRGRDEYRRRAERVFSAFGDPLMRRGLALPYMLAALDFYLDEPQEIVITAPRAAADLAALLAPLRMVFAPNRVSSLVLGERSDAHAALVSLVQGRQPEAGGAVAYVCRGQVCELPTRDPAVLAQALGRALPYRDEPRPASRVGTERREDAAAERSPTSDG